MRILSHQSVRVLFVAAITLLLTVSAFAKEITVKGKVVDSKGEPVIGAGVLVKGTTNGAITDLDGNYSLVVDSKAVLEYSFLGMASQDVLVNGRGVIDVTLVEDSESLEATVVVAYGAQKRASLTGAVSTVNDKDLLKSPAMNISNIVGARVSGISAVQSSGQPGSDQATLTVRGQSGIVYVIDGIRRSVDDFNGLDPNEIASISVLKDASAVAVYGLDCNGAFVVTTKKGRDEDVSINYSGQVGFSNNAEKQEWLDGPSYAYWYNKARVLQGDSEIFTAEMVQKMKDGVDGWGNTNWYDQIYGTGFRQHHNVSASGGNEKLHFFASLGYLDEKGNIKNFNYNRYNARLNADAKFGKGWSVSMGMAARIENRNQPAYSANPSNFWNIPEQTCFALPFVPLQMAGSDGTMHYTSTPTAGSPVSPVACSEDSGYNRSQKVYIQTNFSLQYDAPWLPGLKFRFQGAYDVMTSMGKALRVPMTTMLVSFPTATTETLSYKEGYFSPSGDTSVLSESNSKQTDITTLSSISYNNTFAKHTVGAMILAETRHRLTNNNGATGYGLDFIQLDELSKVTSVTGAGETKIPTISGGSAESKVAGFVARLNYNYAERYYIEGSFRYDGSYLFGGMNQRWVPLPGLSVAWRIKNEDWFRAQWVDNLKIRAGIGKTATSGVSAFQWLNTMATASNAVVIGNASQSAIYADVLGNPNLTWSTCLNYNVGVDATLWHGLLTFEGDAYYKYETGKLSTVTGSYPPSMGGYYYSSANVNEIDVKGFDLTLTHQNRVGDFGYGLKFIWSYAYSRWVYYAGDSENAPEYQRLTGKQVGTKIGMVADGLYQSQEEIDNSAIDASRQPYVGYIRYRDLNGDGVISLAQDKAYVGKSSTPTHTGSLDFFADWKGIDIDILFAWGLGHEVGIQGVYNGVDGVANGTHGATAFSRPFYQNGNAPVYLVTNAWTPEHTDAEFPRLEISPQSLGNGLASTFWYRKGDYIRIKSAQIGYTFPARWMAKANIKKLRIFAEGFNLFTLSALTKYNIDPEAPSVNNGYYPQQRTVTIGLNLSF